MLEHHHLERLLRAMPRLRNAEPDVLRDFQAVAFYAKIDAGRDVFALGDRVDAIALLLAGSVRVYKIGDTGREITLYRFSAGESCILTANAILSGETFNAVATVEEPAEAVLIPADHFRHWVNRHAIWRDFVFDLLSQRLSSVMEVVEEVTFGRLDSRIASLLLARTPNEALLTVTHQEIADELGSSREVVSRVLGGFANAGMIRLGRGHIAITDREALEHVSLR